MTDAHRRNARIVEWAKVLADPQRVTRIDMHFRIACAEKDITFTKEKYRCLAPGLKRKLA